MWLSNKAYMQRSTGVAPRISLSAWQWKAVLCSSGEWNDQSVVDHQRRGEKLSLDLDKRTHMVPSKWRPLWLTTICNMPGQSWSKQDSECGKKEDRNAFFSPSFSAMLSSGGGKPPQKSLFKWSGTFYWVIIGEQSFTGQQIFKQLEESVFHQMECFHFIWFRHARTHTHSSVFAAPFLPGKPTHPSLSCFHLPQEPKEIKCFAGTLCQIKHLLSFCITSFCLLPDSFRSFSQPQLCVYLFYLSDHWLLFLSFTNSIFSTKLHSSQWRSHRHHVTGVSKTKTAGLFSTECLIVYFFCFASCEEL